MTRFNNPQNQSTEQHQGTIFRTAFRPSAKTVLALLGTGLVASPLAIQPISAQIQSSQAPQTPACYSVSEGRINVYEEPNSNAKVIASYVQGDKAYATTNEPTKSNDGVNAFVEVAMYDGNVGWAPLTNEGFAGPLERLTSDQCPNPGPGAVGYDTTASYCLLVADRKVNVFSEPDLTAKVIAAYDPGDIAYTTTNRPQWEKDDVEQLPFIEVAIYDGHTGWVPRYHNDLSPALVDLSHNQCSVPGPSAAGFDG